MDARATADAIVAGDVRTAARVLRLLDDQSPQAVDILRALYPKTGRAHIIGVTGSPGSGKSTLVARLVGEYRNRNRTVGVLAIDPSSPFSGGAILGDRIRMMEHGEDDGVFIRSVATRGALGGLSASTAGMVDVLDAMGLDMVIIETVGVGQDEVDIVRTAQTTVVVVVPGLGDDIQAIKAGILEIADVFVVNKADKHGADQTIADLRSMQNLYAGQPKWLPPILATVATSNDGVIEVVNAVDQHLANGREDGLTEHRELLRAAFSIEQLVRQLSGGRVAGWLNESEAGQALLEDVVGKHIHPYDAAQRALETLLEKMPDA